jgi:hypothetical protein
MGTRADFYIGRGATAEWLGSIAWDGYPQGIMPHKARRALDEWPAGGHLFDATTDAEFRSRLARFFEHREDVTLPANGWPWPWEDSNTTDYAYALDGGVVYGICFGHRWFVAAEDEPEDVGNAKEGVFPQFPTERTAEPGSQRSGVIVARL